MSEDTTRRKLTRKQERFVAEYLIDLNATQAAIRAGYSAKTAYSMGQRLLKQEPVASAIQREMDLRAERTHTTADEVLQELRKLALANMLDYITVQDGEAYVDLSRLNRAKAAAIQEVTVEEYVEGRGEDKRNVKRTRFKLADKKGSLELLGKHLKLWTDKLEIKDDVSQLSDEELEQRLAALAAEMGYVKAGVK